MVKLTIEKEYTGGEKQSIVVDLPKDLNLAINFQNPMFHQEDNFSYPFTLPASAKNRRLFDTKWKEYPAVFSVNGIDLFHGVAVKFKEKKNSIEIFLKSGNCNFWGKIKDVYMDGFDFGSESNVGRSVSSVINDFDNTLDGCYPQYKYVTPPIYMPSFYDMDKGEGYIRDRINMYDVTTNKLVETITEEVTVDGVTEQQTLKNTIVLCFYMRYLFDTIFENNGYKIVENEMDLYPDLNNLYVLSINRVSDFDNIEYRESLPHILLKDFLIEVCKRFCMSFYINESSKTVVVKFNKSVLNAPGGIDLTWNRLKENEISYEEPKNGHILTQENDDDDFSKYAKIRKEVMERLPVVELEDINDKEYDPVSGRTIPWKKDTLYYIKNIGKYFEYKTYVNEDDRTVYYKALVAEMNDVYTGIGIKKIELTSKTLMISNYSKRTKTTTNNTNGTTTIREWNFTLGTPGSSSLSGQDVNLIRNVKQENELDLYFLFYWGKNTETEYEVAYTYPISSYDKYTYFGDGYSKPMKKNDGTDPVLSLRTRDIYDVFYKEWIEFLDSNYIKDTSDYVIPLTRLIQIKSFDSIILNNKAYLIDKIRMDVCNNGVKKTEITLYKK